MSPLFDHVAGWIRAGVQLLLDQLGAQLGPVRFRIWYEYSGQGIEFTLPSLADAERSAPRFATVQDQGSLPAASAEGRAVLLLLRGKPPMIGKEVARALGMPYGPRLRALLSRLRKDGLVDNAKGYVLTRAGERVLDARPAGG